MGVLNGKLGSDNTFLSQVMGKHSPGDRNDIGGRFVDFTSFPRLAFVRAEGMPRAVGFQLTDMV